MSSMLLLSKALAVMIVAVIAAQNSSTHAAEPPPGAYGDAPLSASAQLSPPVYTGPGGTVTSSRITVTASITPYAAVKAALDISGTRSDGVPVQLTDIYCDITRGDRNDPESADTMACSLSLSDGDYAATVKTWDQDGALRAASGVFTVAVPVLYTGPSGTLGVADAAISASLERYVARKARLDLSGTRADGQAVDMKDLYCEITRGYPDRIDCPAALSDGDYRATVKVWDENGFLRTAGGDFRVLVPLEYRSPSGIVAGGDVTVSAGMPPFTAERAVLDIQGTGVDGGQVSLAGLHCGITRGDRNDSASNDEISCPVSLPDGDYLATVKTWDSRGFLRAAAGEFAVAQKPLLAMSRGAIYWRSYEDYLARQLSVELTITNQGRADALGVRIAGSANSNGVTLSSPVPLEIGDISAGQLATASLSYQVPAGVAGFRARLTATSSNPAGMMYSYP